jgi:hypothetical protein
MMQEKQSRDTTSSQKTKRKPVFTFLERSTAGSVHRDEFLIKESPSHFLPCEVWVSHVPFEGRPAIPDPRIESCVDTKEGLDGGGCANNGFLIFFFSFNIS